MNENIFKRNELLAQNVIKGLNSRKMCGHYAASKEEALKIALELIPKGSTVTRGGSASVDEIGLPDALIKGDYNYINRNEAADKRAAELAAFDSDVFIAGTNAITSNGILVNIDGIANRVAAIAYGPRRVVLIVGMNKVTKDLDGAIKRAREVAAPVNVQRFSRDTPCQKGGTCFNCSVEDTICNQIMITRGSWERDRVHVILVNDSLGF